MDAFFALPRLRKPAADALLAGVLAGLAWFAWRSAPQPRPAPLSLPWWRPDRPLVIVAGGAPEAPPYTLPAFRRAVACGAPALEAPVRFTADGEPVVYPGADLAETTDGQGPVGALSLSELQLLDAGHRFADSDGGHPFRGQGLQVPLLEEVLAAFPGIPLFVDVVDPNPAPAHLERLARLVKRWEVSAAMLVAGRSAGVAAALRRLLPEAPAVSTPEEAASFLRLARAGLAGLTRPAFHVLRCGSAPLSARQVAAARRRRLAVLAGPVSSPAEARRLAESGVDALILTGPAAFLPPPPGRRAAR